MSSDDLVEAIENNDLEQTQALIAQGADVNQRNEYGTAPIIAAVRNGDQDIILLLIENGANVNVKDELGAATSLYIAIEDIEDYYVVDMLIQAGADLSLLYRNQYDANDKDLKTALMFACMRRNRLDLVEMLLQAGVDVNQKSSDGNTALMITAASDNPDQFSVLNLLLQRGADKSMTNNEGKTALDLCTDDECKRIISGIEEIRVELEGESEDEHDSDEIDEDRVELDEADEEEEPQTWVKEEIFDHDHQVFSVAFSPDGKEFAVAGGTFSITSSAVKRWNVATFSEMEDSLLSTMYDVVYTPDDKSLVMAAGDIGVFVQSRAGDNTRVLNENSSPVGTVDVSPDGKMILSASQDRIIRLWNIETGQLIQRFSDHQNDKEIIQCVKFSPDGEHFASVADNLMIWSISHGLMKTIKGNGEDELTTFEYSPDGQRIASLTPDNCFVWDVKNKLELAFSLSANERVMTAVKYTLDGKYIFTARNEDVSGENATICVWDANTGELVRIVDGGLSYISSLAMSLDGVHILIGGWDEDDKGEVLLGKISNLLAGGTVPNFPKQLQSTQLKSQTLELTQEPDIFDVMMAESYPLSTYLQENPDNVVFLIDVRNGFGYDRDQLRSMTIGDQDYYFKCLSLNEHLVVALTKVAGETPYVLLRSAGTFYVPAEQLQAALDDTNHNLFMLQEHGTLPYTASIGVVEVSQPQRNYRGEQINVVSKDHCQAGSNKKAYELIAIEKQT